jgi:hypothetical protein
MVRDESEMIEVHDIEAPEQAQIALGKLIAGRHYCNINKKGNVSEHRRNKGPFAASLLKAKYFLYSLSGVNFRFDLVIYQRSGSRE